MNKNLRLKLFAILNACMYYTDPDEKDQEIKIYQHTYSMETGYNCGKPYIRIVCTKERMISELVWVRNPTSISVTDYRLIKHRYIVDGHQYNGADGLYREVKFRDANGEELWYDCYKTEISDKYVMISVLSDMNKDAEVCSDLHEFEPLLKKMDVDARVASLTYVDGLSNVIDTIKFDSCGIYLYPEPAKTLLSVESGDKDIYDFTCALLEANPRFGKSSDIVKSDMKMAHVCFCSFSLTYHDWSFQELGNKFYGVGRDTNNQSWFRFPTYLPVDIIKLLDEGERVHLVLPIKAMYFNINYPYNEYEMITLEDKYIPNYRFMMNMMVTPMQKISPFDGFGGIEEMLKIVNRGDE